jgi:hypothetical protein
VWVRSYKREVEMRSDRDAMEGSCQRQCKNDPPRQLKIDPPWKN